MERYCKWTLSYAYQIVEGDIVPHSRGVRFVVSPWDKVSKTSSFNRESDRGRVGFDGVNIFTVVLLLSDNHGFLSSQETSFSSSMQVEY
jgi:hypothetical protein